MKHLRILFIALLMLGAGVLAQSAQPADAAFHIMRVWEVGGGAGGDGNIQYVELRLAAAGQNLVNGHEVCFFDAAGTAKARLAFTANGANGANGASILMGTTEFDAAWAAGSPDFVFGSGVGSTMTALNGGDMLHPVQHPAGKVSFGDFDAACATIGVIDSVAYGAYTGVVELPPLEPSSLPISGNSGLKLVTALCHPNSGAACPRANDTDYNLMDINTPAGNNPRNNGGLSGIIVPPIQPGSDTYETPPAGPTGQDFTNTPILAGFFDPGSDPFIDPVNYQGVPIGPLATNGTTDTIIRRPGGTAAIPPPFPNTAMVPIEIIALNLVSVNPITVRYSGVNPESWNVSVGLSANPPPQGQMTITKTQANGGTFSSQLNVRPLFTFTRVSDNAVRTLDWATTPYQPIQYQSNGTPWRDVCPAGVNFVPGVQSNFCAGVNDTIRVATTLQTGAPAPNISTAQQTILPACSDPDADGVSDCVPDNCPTTANANQANNDGDALGDLCDLDDDNDGVLDGSDNCQFVANTNQANFDGDALGDICDADDDNDGLLDTIDLDDDNDGVTDVAEDPCGGATPSSLRPERTDVAPFLGVDDDGDTMVDEALPGGAANFDCDGDGYKGQVETGTPLCGNAKNDDNLAVPPDDAVIDDGCPGGPAQVGTYSEAQFKIGTNDQDACGTNGWAADLVSTGPSANKITLTDLSSFVAMPKRLGTSPGDANFNARWDLVPGPVGISGKFIVLTDLTSITTLYPPMLGSGATLGTVKAFSGPVCPWPP